MMTDLDDSCDKFDGEKMTNLGMRDGEKTLWQKCGSIRRGRWQNWGILDVGLRMRSDGIAQI